MFYDAAGRLRIEVEGPWLDGLKTDGELKKPLCPDEYAPSARWRRRRAAGRQAGLRSGGAPYGGGRGAARKKDGQTVSGDTGPGSAGRRQSLCPSVRRYGQPAPASEDSTPAVRLLEQFLRAGWP